MRNVQAHELTVGQRFDWFDCNRLGFEVVAIDHEAQTISYYLVETLVTRSFDYVNAGGAWVE